MTEKQTAQDVAYLASCAVNERTPDQARVEKMDLDAVYAFAARHMISCVVAFALESAGYKDKRSTDTIAAAQWRSIVYECAYGEMKNALEAAGIWLMPLKGAVLKDLYPKYGMREFSDYDILFDADRAEDVKTILEGLGYTTHKFGVDKHDCYGKKPGLAFEMHRALFNEEYYKDLYEYFQGARDRLIGDGLEKRFTPEDFYLYLLAHEYKHYSSSGTGLRSLLDTYVFLRHETIDLRYVAAEAKKLGLADFEKQSRSLALHFFSDGSLTPADQEMLEYLFSSGVAGVVTHRVENWMKDSGQGKLQYMLHRFIVPVSKKNKEYAFFADKYPFFYRHKLLLPLLPFYRIFRAIKSGQFQAEANAITETKQ